MLLFLVDKKGFTIQKNKNTYDLIFIDKNLLLSKNRKVN